MKIISSVSASAGDGTVEEELVRRSGGRLSLDYWQGEVACWSGRNKKRQLCGYGVLQRSGGCALGILAIGISLR